MQCHSENAISVKEIVTEIESISQGVGQVQLKGDMLSNPCHTPKKNTVHELPLERAQAPENKPGHLEQDESFYTVQPELAKESEKYNPEGCLTVHPSTVDLEEEEPVEEEHDWGPGMHPGAKWCPGSVKRATLEFEERLRQEQEHHGTASAGATLSSRKNSKNDSSVADLMPKWKSDETTPEHSFPPREAEVSKGKGKCSGSETGPLSHCERNATAPAPELESHSLQTPQNYLGLDTGTKKQEKDLKKQRTVIPNQECETQAIPLPLPKRIEIIEYTQTVTTLDHTEPGDETAPSKEGEKQGLRKVKMERSVTMFCALDENLNRTLDPSQVPLHPQVLPLPHSSSEYERLTDPTPMLSSPEDKGNGPSAPFKKAAPLVSGSTHIAPINLDYLHPQSGVHLEGCTEQSSTTDSEPSTEQGRWEDSQEGFLSGGSGVAHKLFQLSNEDLNLINKLGDSAGVLQKKLDPSPEACRIPHSSSSENIRNLSHSPGVVKERAKEIETRVTFQAGLTKTSQMRRSASLAKLGYLDLCKDYLAERELASLESPHLKLLQPFIRTDSGMHALMAQEPLESPGAHQNPQPTKYFVEQLKTTECIAQSKPVERPLVQYAKEFGYSQQCLLPKARPELTSPEVGLPLLQTQGLQCTGPAPGLAVAPRQQHGRTHPLRRLKRANDKKRTTNPFYNTM